MLQGVDLLCAGGTVTCIVGPNGAGKSTVLRVVSGLLTPTEGTVMMGDVTLSGAVRRPRSCGPASPRCRSRRRCSRTMTVRENVLMGGFLIRRDKKLLTSRLERSRSWCRSSPTARTSRAATSPAASAGWSRSPAA